MNTSELGRTLRGCCRLQYYYLDPPCLEGLELFYRYAAEIGALPQAAELRLA